MLKPSGSKDNAYKYFMETDILLSNKKTLYHSFDVVNNSTTTPCFSFGIFYFLYRMYKI